MTECNAAQLEFHGLGRRTVVADFNGGKISSDGGVLLLREVEARTGILARLAGQFVDYRSAELVEHTVLELVSQRVLGLALGYEDLNDHDELAPDPLLAVVVGKARSDRAGSRRASAIRGKALASSTLNRLELHAGGRPTPSVATRRSSPTPRRIDRLLVDLLLEAYDSAPEAIVLDLDATDDPLHGTPGGAVLPRLLRLLLLPAAVHLLRAITCCAHGCVRRTSTRCEGTVEELERIVGADPRAAGPRRRSSSAATRASAARTLMAWCEAAGRGLRARAWRKNAPAPETRASGRACRRRSTTLHERPGRAGCFSEFQLPHPARPGAGSGGWWQGRASRGKGANPRFVVTSLCARGGRCPAPSTRTLYCARGDMENRIKEQQLDLFADRTSTATMRANQIRLYFSSLRLRAAVRAAPLGLGRYRAGARPVRHDPPEAPEDRGPGAHQRTPGAGVVLGRLPQRRALSRSARQDPRPGPRPERSLIPRSAPLARLAEATHGSGDGADGRLWPKARKTRFGYWQLPRNGPERARIRCQTPLLFPPERRFPARAALQRQISPPPRRGPGGGERCGLGGVRHTVADSG